MKKTLAAALVTIVASLAFSNAANAKSNKKQVRSMYKTALKYKDRYGLPEEVANDEDKPLVKPFVPRQPGDNGDEDSAFIQEYTKEADFFEHPVTSRTWKEDPDSQSDESVE